jgi:hypothetical protein
MIVISEDRMRLQLNKLVASVSRNQKWHAPMGMLLAEVVALTASSFHSAFGLSGDQWDLLFRLLVGVTLLWLVKTGINRRRAASVDVDGVIDSFKDREL